MGHERLFTVGELAKKSGVTVRTLQFYDRSGLLSPSRHSDGGRRLYGVDDVLRLQQILFYKRFGFSLDEIRGRLMSVDSAQDFAQILLRQKSIVEQQIQYLQQTAALMEKTVEELRQSEDLSINLMIARLSAAEQDDFFVFVMKSVGRESLEALILQAESSEGDQTDNDWRALLLRLKELHRSGADPYGKEGESLAEDWWNRITRLTGGDPELTAAVLKAGETLSGWPEEVGDAKTAIEEFLSPALGNYFIKKGIVPTGMEEYAE